MVKRSASLHGGSCILTIPIIETFRHNNSMGLYRNPNLGVLRVATSGSLTATSTTRNCMISNKHF